MSLDRPLSAASRPSDFLMDCDTSSRCRPAQPCELSTRGDLRRSQRALSGKDSSVCVWSLSMAVTQVLAMSGAVDL